MIFHITKFVGAAAVFASIAPLGIFVRAESIRALSSPEPNNVEVIAAASDANDHADRKLASEVRSLGFDTDMEDFMRSSLVTKMSTQRMVDETLVLNGEVLTFDDKHLEPVRVAADGSNANIYKLLPGGRSKHGDETSTVRVLKKPDGTIGYVSIHIIATGERIGAAAFGKAKNDLYAISSSDDLDGEAMSNLKLESEGEPNDDGDEQDASDGSSSRDKKNKKNDRGRGKKNGDRALESGTCSSYKVIRLNARFDAGFCASYNGDEQDAIDRINLIVSEFNDSYMEYPLCTKVETCGVSGSCNVKKDRYTSMIESSTRFCNECDTTALFFGNDVNGNDWFPSTSTIGCASVGSICNQGAASVNQIGQFSNVAAQAALLAHELAHNLNARHDNSGGFIMAPSFCHNCGNIAESFSSASASRMSSFIEKRDTSTCVGYEAAGSGSGRVPAPTSAPVAPTPSPVSAPGVDSRTCNRYDSFGSCYYGGCVWNGSCYSEDQITCEELTHRFYCLYNGAGCAWDLTNQRCITYPF